MAAKLIAFTTTVHGVGLWEQNSCVQAAALRKVAWKYHFDFGGSLGATQLT